MRDIIYIHTYLAKELEGIDTTARKLIWDVTHNLYYKFEKEEESSLPWLLTTHLYHSTFHARPLFGLENFMLQGFPRHALTKGPAMNDDSLRLMAGNTQSIPMAGKMVAMFFCTSITQEPDVQESLKTEFTTTA